MHGFPWIWVLIAMVFWFCFARPRWLRACQGDWRDAGIGDPRERSGERRRRHARGEDPIAARDALIAKLEERVRVLERIVTDEPSRLRAEIDSLRDAPPERG